MLKVLVDYPTHDQELTVVSRSLEAPPQLAQVLSLEELKELQAQVADGVRRSRRSSAGSSTSRPRRASPAEHGARSRSPRTSRTARARAGRSASIAAARALALLRGRDYVLAGRRRGAAPRRLPPPPRPLLPGARGGGHRRSRARRGPRVGRSAADRPQRRRQRRPRRREGSQAPHVACGRARPARPGPGSSPPRASGARACDRPPRRRPARGRLPLGVRRASAASSSRCGRTSRATTCAGSTGTSPPGPGETHVRVELAERVLVTWLVLDSSASMAFGTADRRKADVAEGVALAVGHAATPARQPARPRRVRRRRTRVPPAAAGTPRPAADARRDPRRRPAGDGSLGEALALVDGLAVQRSLVVVVSDFRGPIDWRQPLLRVAGAASDGRGRDPRPARAGARRRRRAAARRSRDGPPAARRHERPRAPRALRRPRRRGAPERSCGCSRRSASGTSRSRPRATGCGRSRRSCGGAPGE